MRFIAIIRNLKERFVTQPSQIQVITLGGTLPRALAGETLCHFPIGVNPLGVVRMLLLPFESHDSLAASARKAVSSSRLPTLWRQKIGRDSVQFLPHEYAPAMGEDAYQLAILPTFQLYSAYLPRLDEMCCNLYWNELAPKWIVCSVDPHWCGFFLNYPKTWTAIFRRYRLDAECDGRLLLRRRDLESASKDDTHETGVKSNRGCQEMVIRANDWFDCSQWGASCVVIRWPQTFMGRFCSLFLRNTMTFVSLRYKEGDVATIPVLSENLNSPFPFSRIAVTTTDFVEVFKGNSSRTPVSMCFHAESPWLYAKHIRLVVFPSQSSCMNSYMGSVN